MKASDVMTVGAVTVRTDSSIAYAARLMIESRISGLPVVDGRGELAGIITEGDLLRRREIGTADRPGSRLDIWRNAAELAHQYAREHGKKVVDVMSHEVVSVGPDADIRDIVDLMETRRVRRVPVIRDGKVVGVVSRANLLSALARLAGDAPRPVVEDLTIRQHIVDEITGKPWAPGSTFDILVRDGVVTLNGTVEAEQVRDAVRVAAENAPGAVRVWDNLQIVSVPDDFQQR